MISARALVTDPVSTAMRIRCCKLLLRLLCSNRLADLRTLLRQ